MTIQEYRDGQRKKQLVEIEKNAFESVKNGWPTDGKSQLVKIKAERRQFKLDKIESKQYGW